MRIRDIHMLVSGNSTALSTDFFNEDHHPYFISIDAFGMK